MDMHRIGICVRLLQNPLRRECLPVRPPLNGSSMQREGPLPRGPSPRSGQRMIIIVPLGKGVYFMPVLAVK
jgi:hypothetical protein